MSMDTIPVEVIFLATMIVVAIGIEVGFRLGLVVHRRSENEKASSVSTVAAAILSLAGFMLVFTFGIAAERMNDRKKLVREEANAIGTAWLRSDFLPEPDRAESAGLLRKYVDIRLDAVQGTSPDQIQKLVVESQRIQRQVWDMAVKNARKDMDSDVAALYIESLNTVIDLHGTRTAIALHAQIPGTLWLILYALIILGVIGVGYQTAIAGSTRRTLATSILAPSFAMVIALIAALDSPRSGIRAPQGPLIELQSTMSHSPETSADPGHKP
ncbi:Protein of unknown function [Nitrosospira sp. Nsp14]|nr:Protein of unknown function [Nitrosospira sp. Nsp14]